MRAIDASASTILFGAGVTRAAGGPTAAELLDAIADEFVTAPRLRQVIVSKIQPRGPLRFETAMDELKSTADPELRVLRFLNEMTPGPLHASLAHAAHLGARLITVNFDDLAELALSDRGLEPWTIDAQQPGERALPADSVVKLHGTLRQHRGAHDPECSEMPLWATVSAIVSGGGGRGLPEYADRLLHSLVDGRALVVLGYSGSDDFDVMPALGDMSPSEVIWVWHDDSAIRCVDARDVAHPPVQNLLRHWETRGIDISVIAGRSDEALAALGWWTAPRWSADKIAAVQRRWRAHIRHWAAAAHEHDPSGLGWVAEMHGSLGHFDDEYDALNASVPSSRSDGLWSRPRLLFALAENAYLREVERTEVRRLADAALAVASAGGDPLTVAALHHLKARTFRVTDREDLAAAQKEVAAAREALAGTGPTGREADLDLETSRLHLAQSDYKAAIDTAAKAARTFWSVGDLRMASEARQVEGHALALNADFDDALAALHEARRLAETGPYEERRIAAHGALASLYDSLDDAEACIEHAEAGIEIALKTNHVGEIAQNYAMLGLALSEIGAFSGAADAFAKGLDTVVPATDSFRDILACGLADSLLHLDKPDAAVGVLDQHRDAVESDPKHRLHAAAIRWRAGHAIELEVRQAAADVTAAGDDPVGQTVFAVVRLAVPGADAARLVDEARRLMIDAEQDNRLRRLTAARRWPE